MRRATGHFVVGGFTLVEVLLATSLLAAGMGLAFLTLRGAGVATERAQLLAAESERLRAVQGFMRRQLAGALPLPIEIDPATGEASLFEASRHRIRWVAPMPGYLSRGGPHVQTLALVPEPDGLRLEFSHALLTPEGPAAAERAPEVLLRGIAEGDFAVRALLPEGNVGPWQASWDTPAQLPQLVRLRLRMQSASSHFPEMTVPLRLGAVHGSAALPIQMMPDDANEGRPTR